MKLRHLLAGLALVFSLSLTSGLQVASAQSLNNFTIQTYNIDYRLGRDNDNRSILHTTETIVAKFPSTNQNHGIERAIPKIYDHHSTSLDIVSVTNNVGSTLNYTTYDSNDNTVLRIGDADTYVHGLQTYRISYTQRDVTRHFADTQANEFYWDTNGTEWAVPIAVLSINIHFEDGLTARLNGNNACYLGVSGSTNRCAIDKSDDRTYSITANDLQPGQNITVAFGFPTGTFAPHRPSPGEIFARYFALMSIVSIPFALVALVIVCLRYSRISNRTRERTTIVPEYLPPSDTSVTVAARITNRPAASFAAQMIDFAVRGYTKIYEVRPKSFFRNAEYEIEITKDLKDLKDEEQEIFRDIFPTTSVGTRLNMSDLRKDTTLYMRVSDNKGKIDKNIRGIYGLRIKDNVARSWFRRAALVLIVVAILTVSIWIAIVAIVSIVLSFLLYPLTDKGLMLWQYLQGLQMYIKTAEADRLNMLQSPNGALKLDAPINTNDKRQLLKLYEKVLPYAILFGLEKDWNKQLGQYYESLKQSPEWYSGNTAVFNAAIFSSAMSSFSTTSTYSGAASSSSGGSTGGGSSGGGGGGGGGGGW